VGHLIERLIAHVPFFMATPRNTGIAHYCHQPRFSIPAPVAVKEPEGAQVRFLDYVLRVMLIAGQPSG
jgi:hypothetical protein